MPSNYNINIFLTYLSLIPTYCLPRSTQACLNLPRGYLGFLTYLTCLAAFHTQDTQPTYLTQLCIYPNLVIPSCLLIYLDQLPLFQDEYQSCTCSHTIIVMQDYIHRIMIIVTYDYLLQLHDQVWIVVVKCPSHGFHILVQCPTCDILYLCSYSL